nr:NADH dehydrogenase subunit 5 [Eusirus cf. giganteus clade g2]
MLNLNVYKIFMKTLVFLSFILFVVGLHLGLTTKVFFIEWSVFKLESSEVVISLMMDWMSCVFLSVVCLISGSIFNYCGYYMEGELAYLRFSFVMAFFVASMCALIISPNLISILLGWDGLGLTSYILVIFYQNESSCNAGMLTILSNRVGDVAILMSIGLMSYKGSWGFNYLSELDPKVVGLVCLAAFTKSAQIPFSAWLPAAMAAPTPVSALVHSSTLVTAGVYLLIRFQSMILTSGLSYLILLVGVVTMFMSGLGANFEGDMKKIVALSTLSQLGLMMMTLGLGCAELAFFHLITHALFKSSLFMCAGFMIHSAGGSQDTRHMSSLSVSSPILGVVLSVTNMALCGFPFLAGFYSKDQILEHMLMSSGNFLLAVAALLATGLTMSYSVRLIFKGVGASSMTSPLSGLSDMNKSLVNSVSVLVVLSSVGGFLMNQAFYLSGSGFVLGSVQKYLVLSVISVLGLSMFMLLGVHTKITSFSQRSLIVHKLVSCMWFLPFLSTKPMNKVVFSGGGFNSKNLDLGWSEHYGGQGGKALLEKFSAILQSSQQSVAVSSYLVVGGFMVSLVLLF